MKGEVNPVVGGIIIAVVVLVICVLGFRAMRAGRYPMSPGGGPRQLSAGTAASPSSGGGAYMPSGGKAVSGQANGQGGVPTSSGGMNGGMNGGGQ